MTSPEVDFGLPVIGVIEPFITRPGQGHPPCQVGVRSYSTLSSWAPRACQAPVRFLPPGTSPEGTALPECAGPGTKDSASSDEGCPCPRRTLPPLPLSCS